MRIVMMGTGPFAVPTFRALVGQDGCDVCALITRPVPPPTGRRKSTASAINPMRDHAESLGLPIYAPDSVNDVAFAQTLIDLRAELFVVCDYGQILSPAVLSIPRLGGINLHGSLLPKYRGAAPVNWAIYQGETETGVTVIHMTPQLDGGPTLVQRRLAIAPEADAIQLEHQLAETGVSAVHEAIVMLSSWDGHATLGVRQDDRSATRAPRLKKRDGWINWQRTAVQIRDQVRAFKPWPGSFTQWHHPKRGPLRLSVGHVSVVPFTTAAESPGCVAAAENGQILVACGAGHLSLDQIQPAGKRMLSATEFLRGYPMRTGDSLAAAVGSGRPA